MGGALDAMGNHGPLNPETGKSYAEFNFYCDPYGVDRVLKSGLRVTIVPWDLTEQIVLTHLELVRFQSSTPQGDFVLKLVKNFLESYGNANDRSFEFNDCITISALQGSGSLRSEFIRITLEGEQAGRIVRDRNNGAELSFFNLDLGKITSVCNAILHDVGCNLDCKG
jgi:inosine-uridine nucleoside N-ribohydrolase